MARKGRKQSLQDMGDVWDFTKRFAGKYGLSEIRMQELADILKEALFSSATGKLGVRKATSLALRFIGTAMDIDEGDTIHLG